MVFSHLQNSAYRIYINIMVEGYWYLYSGIPTRHARLTPQYIQSKFKLFTSKTFNPRLKYLCARFQNKSQTLSIQREREKQIVVAWPIYVYDFQNRSSYKDIFYIEFLYTQTGCYRNKIANHRYIL